MSSLAVEKVLAIESGKGITASGHIPKNSEFFQDHFPDFPVLPGVLALEMLKQTAQCYLESTQDKGTRHCCLKHVHATRFSSYLRPGDEWESQLKLVSEKGNETQWKAILRHKGKVAVSTQLTMESKPVVQAAS